MRRLRTLLLAAALASLPAAADIFVLKDGRRLEGVAVEDGETWIITTADGERIRVPKSELIGQTRAAPQRNEYIRRAANIRPDDAAAHYELAQWAEQQGMKDEAEAQHQLVLKHDPFHQGAGKALGYEVQKDGRWAPKGAAKAAEPKDVADRTPPKDPAQLRQEAREIARDLEKMALTDSTDWEKAPEVQAMIRKAQARPDLFALILKAPGHQGSAGIPDGIVRAKAAVVLGLAGDRGSMQPLLDACFEDPDDRVRWAAAKALPRLEEPVALRKLADVAVKIELPWPTRKLAAIAIRRYADKDGIERLLKELAFELAGGNFQDPKNPPRAANKGPGTDNPFGIEVDPMPLTPPDEVAIYPALSAIKVVTGVSFERSEKDYKTWGLWWKQNRDTFQFKD